MVGGEGKKILAVMVGIMIIAIALVFLITGEERPIRAPADSVVLTEADLPDGWMENNTWWMTYEELPGADWGWTGKSTFFNNTPGDTWNLWIYITSYNSTDRANENFGHMKFHFKEFTDSYVPMSLGDEGFFTTAMEGGAGNMFSYVFRKNNVQVTINIDRDGEYIGEVQPWMDQIAYDQAAKVRSLAD